MRKFIPESLYDHLPHTASRLEWAEKLGSDLSRSIRLWERNTKLGVRAEISDDRPSCIWRLQLDSSPNLERWGFKYGDAVHNLRSALDNAVYEKAISLGVATGLDQLEFPLCDDISQWKNKARKVKHLPDSLIVRIEELQPYNSKDENAKAILCMLRDLNNIDKHRVPLVSAGAVMGSQTTVDAEPFDGEKPHEWHWDIGIPAESLPFTPFQNDAVLLKLSSKEKLGKIKGKYHLSSQFLVFDINGRPHGLTNSLAQMLDSVVKMIVNMDSH